ncbi:beta-lactamase family protein [Microgenomates group bacterium]|nr:beta-lactamase family protein [Microgenomates group bacterium]
MEGVSREKAGRRETVLISLGTIIVLGVVGYWTAKERLASSEIEPAVIEEEKEDHSWQWDTPENQGVDRAALERWHEAAKEVDIFSTVIVRNGVIVDEYYKEGYDENSVFRFASCTKSISGVLIGIAIDQGLISDVGAKLEEFMPQLSGPEQEDKREITVEHLLTHTSGIYWNEWGGGDYFRQLSQSENWVEFVLGQRMAAESGTVFNYTTGGSHLLGAVIQAAVGMKASEFGKEYLFEPLGMESVVWREDPQGITDGGNGISMTARDAAKLGQLYLNGGKWKDKQIISEEWVRASTKRQAAGSAGTGEYGYSWWLKSFGGYETYYAMGHGGQYILVIPELETVVVMTSRVGDTYLPQYYFNDYIMAAIEV